MSVLHRNVPGYLKPQHDALFFFRYNSKTISTNSTAYNSPNSTAYNSPNSTAYNSPNSTANNSPNSTAYNSPTYTAFNRTKALHTIVKSTPLTTVQTALHTIALTVM